MHFLGPNMKTDMKIIPSVGTTPKSTTKLLFTKQNRSRFRLMVRFANECSPLPKGNENSKVKFFKCFMCVNNYGFNKLTIGMKLPKYKINHILQIIIGKPQKSQCLTHFYPF